MEDHFLDTLTPKGFAEANQLIPATQNIRLYILFFFPLGFKLY